MKKSFETVLVSVAGFSAGVATGLLLSPKKGKEFRKLISSQTNEARHWVGKQGSRLLEESEKKISQISEKLHDLVPDLYEATSDIIFDEEDVESDE